MNALLERRVAIIGRGLAGLTLAFRMAEQGLRPMVFGLAQGPSNASRCAQGIVCNKGLIFAESPLFRAKLRTLRGLEQWLSLIEKSSGLSIPRSWTGVDEPYWDEADFQKTLRRVYRGNFWGCYRPRNCPPHLWQTGLQNFATPAGFMHYPDDAWFDVDATMKALEQACHKKGIEFFAERVEKLINEPNSIVLQTSQQTFLLDHVVLASGAESMNFIQNFGVKQPKIFLVGGQSLSWDKASIGDEASRILVKGNLSLAVRPRHMILGSSSWKPDAHSEAHLQADQKNLLEQAVAAFGLPIAELESEQIRSNWGTRIRFADRMPALGIWPEKSLQQRVSVLTGFYKNGLQLADLCAEQLLNELTGRELSEFGQAFHVKRFLAE